MFWCLLIVGFVLMCSSLIINKQYMDAKLFCILLSSISISLSLVLLYQHEENNLRISKLLKSMLDKSTEEGDE